MVSTIVSQVTVLEEVLQCSCDLMTDEHIRLRSFIEMVKSDEVCFLLVATLQRFQSIVVASFATIFWTFLIGNWYFSSIWLACFGLQQCDTRIPTSEQARALLAIQKFSSKLSSMPGKFGIPGETYYWTTAYHLNIKLYEKLLGSVFDILDEGQLIEVFFLFPLSTQNWMRKHYYANLYWLALGASLYVSLLGSWWISHGY